MGIRFLLKLSQLIILLFVDKSFFNNKLLYYKIIMILIWFNISL